MKTICGVLLMGAVLASSGHAADDLEILDQGGVSVTLADVDGFLQRMPAEQRSNFLSDPKRVEQMLIGILRDRQLAEQATSLKIDQDPHAQAEIAYARTQILSRRRVEAFEASLQIPSMEKAAKEEYMAHRDQFVVPENVKVQHILITYKQRHEDEAQALAEKLRAEAIANPDGFDKLVDEYSEDASKKSNFGYIPEATSNKYVSEFVAAAKKLTKPGEISPVIKTQFGYHVLKLIQRTPSRREDFDTVKAKLLATLKDNYVAEQRKAFLNGLDKGKAGVNQQGMDAFRERYNLESAIDMSQAIKAAEAKSSK